MQIRQAKKNEIKNLQNLHDKAFADDPKYDPDLFLNWSQSEIGATYFTELLQKKDKLCLVAEDNNKLIGYVTAAPKHFDDRNGKYIEIENIGVIPEYRSQGIGQQLMKKCLEWAKESGYKKVYLRCYFRNTNALAFYKNNGFSEISVSLEKNI